MISSSNTNHHGSAKQKSATMDSDKKRMLLNKMKFLRDQSKLQSKQQQQQQQQAKFTGVDILTDDVVGTVSSEDPTGERSLLALQQHRQPVVFDLKSPAYGGYTSTPSRSLSSEARGQVNHRGQSLFGIEDDPPLLLSSINGVATQVNEIS